MPFHGNKPAHGFQLLKVFFTKKSHVHRQQLEKAIQNSCDALKVTGSVYAFHDFLEGSKRVSGLLVMNGIYFADFR